MTRLNLETELLTAWDETMADLTPAERKALAAATPKDWIAAIAELIADPTFWQGIGTAFLNGVQRGLENRR
jgi:hypothetical protein